MNLFADNKSIEIEKKNGTSDIDTINFQTKCVLELLRMTSFVRCL